MATLHLDTKASIEKAQQLTSLVDAGILPTPPTTGQERHTCALCGKRTLLTITTPDGRVCANGCEEAA